ncbi:diguanylate cyclase [Rheinheimera sp. UJ63]|uniref:diguanylate cyclase n=1 Tax=Rheinheimera sp. UJ63 TaxID=2910157 RepID=UPI001F1B3179|nr:diguanylate cyclase [Rheinheimera sp. UJ63]MCF4010250.1 diguanylate cyclase [Rheinheimera sp. UJ63]
MNSTPAKRSPSEAFAQLRQRFEHGLPERLARMVKLAKADASKESLTLLMAEAHKLAGACGTFGYASLGTQARQIEQLTLIIINKTELEQNQAIPSLKRAVIEFEIAMDKALRNKYSELGIPDPIILQPNTIWLILDSKTIIDELSQQLTAFGMQVELFTAFDDCLQRLQNTAPTILLSAITLADGSLLFEQTLLLDQLVKKHARLLVLSAKDNFDLRIKAAQQRADAFFVAPLDIPSCISTITELLETHSGSIGRVFIVDDDTLLAEHYALVLQNVGIETAIVNNVRDIVNELMRFQPDLVLMDIYMPEISGAELAGLIRQYPSLKRIPIVYLSSEVNKSLQLRAMAHGADDFLTKPIDDTQLTQAIKVRLARSIQIKNLIEKDGLTGLIKHSSIKSAVEIELDRTGREQQPLSVVMVDIDLFKSVNDNYGHAIGDVVISALATLLRKRIRKTDRAGRYGGEEFLLVLPDCGAEEAKKITESILDAFRKLKFTADDNTFSCTFSAGVVSTSNQRFSDAATMIVAADDALYHAKETGRNRICLAEDD